MMNVTGTCSEFHVYYVGTSLDNYISQTPPGIIQLYHILIYKHTHTGVQHLKLLLVVPPHVDDILHNMRYRLSGGTFIWLVQLHL